MNIEIEDDAAEESLRILSGAKGDTSAANLLAMMSIAISLKRFADAVCGSPTCTGIHEMMCHRSDDTSPL